MSVPLSDFKNKKYDCKLGLKVGFSRRDNNERSLHAFRAPLHGCKLPGKVLIIDTNELNEFAQTSVCI